MARLIKIGLTANSVRLILLIFFLEYLSSTIIAGQTLKEDQFPYDQKTIDEPPPFKERVFFGGNFGLMFGTVTDIQISPVAGYWLLPRLAVAAGPTYRYYKDRINSTAIYGGKAYLQFVVIKDLNNIFPIGAHTGIFLHIEDEMLSLKTSFWKYPPYKSDRFYVNSVLTGAGISQQFGRRASLNFMVLWPLNDTGYDIYSNPEMRVSFTF